MKREKGKQGKKKGKKKEEVSSPPILPSKKITKLSQ
jgi:hypothetical protein